VPASPDPRLDQLERLLAARAGAPVDERERAAVAAFRAALPGLGRPFDQDADPTHVTSSAIVVGQAGVLLLRHRRLGIWVQPGGHLDPGEDLAAGALREAGEETGLSPVHPPGGPRLVHLDLRWLLLAEGDPRPPPGESQQVAWFPWPTAIGRADAGLAGALTGLRLIFGGPET